MSESRRTAVTLVLDRCAETHRAVDLVADLLFDLDLKLEIERVEIDDPLHAHGHGRGMSAHVWSSIERTGVVWDAANVGKLWRWDLGLETEVVPLRALSPHMSARYPLMDVVVLRRLIGAGSESVKVDTFLKRAAATATRYGRHHLTYLGLPHSEQWAWSRMWPKVAQATGSHYVDHQALTTGVARLRTEPERFDVVVAPELCDDLLHDMVRGTRSSLRTMASARFGPKVAVFSPYVYTPRRPSTISGLLSAAVMMLVDMGHTEEAAALENAWLCAIEEGIHPGEIYDWSHSEVLIDDASFATALSLRLGREPKTLHPACYYRVDTHGLDTKGYPLPKIAARSEIVGVEVVVDGICPSRLAERLLWGSRGLMSLARIVDDATEIWPRRPINKPEPGPWRCLFVDHGPLDSTRIEALLSALDDAGIGVVDQTPITMRLPQVERACSA